MTAEQWLDLRRHPLTRAEAVHAVDVLVSRSSGAELRLTFRLAGDIRRIRLPSLGEPRIAKQLWQHTCFEVFIAVDGQSAYHEFNFAPSREWAAYAFSRYRNGGLVTNEGLHPDIAVRPTGRQLELTSVVRLDELSGIHPRASLRVGLAAVVEANDGLSWWALRHPADRPDFHDADGFALLLEPQSK